MNRHPNSVSREAAERRRTTTTKKKVSRRKQTVRELKLQSKLEDENRDIS